MEYIIVFTHTQLDYDSRIRRQLVQICKSYPVILCCQKGDMESLEALPKNIEYVFFENHVTPLGRKLIEMALDEGIGTGRGIAMNYGSKSISTNMLQLYETYHCDYYQGYKKVLASCIGKKIKAVLCNDVMFLPFAVRLTTYLRKLDSKIVLVGDMHEIHFDYSEDSRDFNQRIRRWACDTYLPKCNVVLTISDWAVREYQNRYKKQLICRLRNLPQYKELPIVKHKKTIKLVHVGIASEQRRLEEMIACMKQLPKQYILDCYLVAVSVTQKSYVAQLDRMIKEARLSDRIAIKSPAPPEQLIDTINDYDIGIFYLDPILNNHKYALPNKLFEYIQARLAVVTTPLVSMKEIIEGYQIGAVSDDFTVESFVRAILKVAEDLTFYKENSQKAAEVLNIEQEVKTLEILIKSAQGK